MARKQMVRSLPPVEHVFKNFKGFPEKESKQLLLTDELRKAAKRFRQRSSRPFYTMRDVAQFFHAPLRTVAIAYQRLELEGLLIRIRSSQTLLAGEELAPRKPVRCVVGIPLWLHSIAVSPFTRILHIELEERLRAHGFVADIIFFREEEVSHPEFAERILMHNLDVAIWHTPHPLATQTLLALEDSGVKQIIVQSADNPSSLKYPTYHQDWHSAYKEFALAWKQHGIRHVIVPEPRYLPAQRAMPSFSAVLRSQGLEVDFVKGPPALLRDTVRRRGATISGLAFLDQLGADAICNEEPVIVEEILQSSRVAFCRGPIRTPYFNHRVAFRDFVGFSASEIAKRISNDLQNGIQFSQGLTHTFHAQYYEGVRFDTVDHL